MLIWRGVLFTWSSPRITWVIRMSMSSTTTQKLYVGVPSGRAITRSSSSSLLISMRPLTLSSQATTPPIGFLKRSTGCTPSGTGGSVLPGSGRQVPS